jgi:hypothetical protein
MRFRQLETAFVVAALVATGCQEPHVAELRIETQSDPFYWYQDTRIFLRIDPRALTVVADSARIPVLAASLENVGVHVDSVTPFGGGPRRWVLWLHAGTTPASAEAAARALRRRSSVAFVSNTYVGDGGVPAPGRPACMLQLIDDVALRYRESTTPEQIAAFQQRAGLSVLRAGDRVYATVLTYPTRTQFTPLEIAAAIDRHPFVEWASPNMTGRGCIHTLD